MKACIYVIFGAFEKGNDSVRERGLWKFNKFLISDSKYIESMEKHICETLCLLDNRHRTDQNLRWEYLKYEIRKFTKKYAKAVAENARKEIDSLEIEPKHLETDLKNYQTSKKHLDCKSKLNEIYSKKANGVRIRSKCDWYESGKKSNKFFLNLEKTSQGLIRTLVKTKKEIKDPVEIITEPQGFIESSSPVISLFQNKM